MNMNRREALRTLAISTASTLTYSWLNSPVYAVADANPSDAKIMSEPFSLPPLSYSYDALEPYIDATTMEIHHTKHHATYVQNLNKAVADQPDLAAKPVEDLLINLNDVPESIRTTIRNHGGGHANHSLFWKCLGKNGAEPEGLLAEAIKQMFESFDSFQEQFADAAKKVFGSGWTWLSLNEEKKLLIETTANQDSPLSLGHIPLLGLDVWEHAYYLKYQNKRADYIAAFQHIIDWQSVSARYLEKMG